ncbi:MAG: dipeptidyl-peptidase 3 family protein [Candidatus Kapaibacterium sp.]
MILRTILAVCAASFIFISCAEKEEDAMTEQMQLDPPIEERVNAYAPVKITADISHLTERQRMLIQKLAEAGRICHDIFWKQSAHDAISTRDSLLQAKGEDTDPYLEYCMINFGPYDVIYGNKRFVGSGPDVRPKGGGFYPVDMTKEEFNAYVEANKDMEEQLTSQYTIIIREGDKLKAIPYHEYYEESIALADKLDEAAQYADNESLKNYLQLRAKAIRTDEYLESDMAWMEIKDNDIDVVIGPIENYEDGLFNYKSAHEAVVMVKDPEATKELDMFYGYLNDFQNKLPYSDAKYKTELNGKGTILQVVNVVYFGGDCQKGTKTIAAALPNDPRVKEAKGAKKTMYKNMMEAKFDKIVVPIGEKLLVPELQQYVDKKAFTSFVTLHEVSHTLGRGYVYGNEDLTVRKALEDRYSPIEETKADILGLYNHKHMLEGGAIDEEYLKNIIATYIAGLYRSIRFGSESAHGLANMIQLNFLREKGAIIKNEEGQFTYDEEKFFDVVAELADIIITIQAEGDYERAGEMLDKYSVVGDEVKKEIESLGDIPRDINTSYEY